MKTKHTLLLEHAVFDELLEVTGNYTAEPAAFEIESVKASGINILPCLSGDAIEDLQQSCLEQDRGTPY